MRVIILAAGRGTRLDKYTKDLPKGMLSLDGKTLIQRQVETLRKAGISEIAIVRGYMAEKISLPNIAYFLNPEYETTNMVATLMQARKFAEVSKDGVLVCYSDILYETKLVKQLADFAGVVGVLVDDDWQGYWKARLGAKWEGDVESLVYDKNNKIIELGKPTRDISRAMSRYVGMIRFSKSGFASFAKAFDENKAKFWDSAAPWRNSKSFRKAQMTCMLQELIDRGVNAEAIHTKHGWMEFDTNEDYEKALAWMKDGTIRKFINFEA